MYYNRKIEKSIEKELFKGKVIIVYGPRQSGKTTLVKKIAEKSSKKYVYFNCEVESVKNGLKEVEPQKIKQFFGNVDIVILDEAQVIENIGLKLKVFNDEYKDIQIIATGSSSFDLRNKINEPLTGRSREFLLYPFSINEIIENTSYSNFKSVEESCFIYGFYPEVFSSNSNIDKYTQLENIATHYLYKDLFMLEDIRKPKVFEKLLKILALTVGSEQSLNNLSNELDISIRTVEKYIDLLEKTFIIKVLNSYSNNKIKEIKKNFKVFFIDIGIRNFLIQNMNTLNIRNDIGGIFENIVIIEKIKNQNDIYKKFYFWRNYDKREIDLLEEYNGKINAFEIKYKGVASKINKIAFLKEYENANIISLNKENYI